MTAPRILVVEDERIIALHLRQRLTDLGYDVPNAVSTGDQALRKIQESPPDLILMDINLKGKLDGIATAAAIPPEYRIPVIYLTAYSSDATLARAVATNPSGYLVKPFSERELHAMIQVT
jgi:CheY-like chemotaxis protein